MKAKLHYLILLFAVAFLAPKANAQTLIQFWDFNNTPPSGGGGGDSLGNATNPLVANQMATGLTAGSIVYTRPTTLYGSSGIKDSILDNGSGGSFFYDYSNSNDSTGGNEYIRTRNPSDSCEMYLNIPTTGYKHIKLQYAISASSTKGAAYSIFSYSTNGGTSWNNLTTAMDTFNIGGVYRPDTLQMINPTTAGSAWYPVQIDFTSDTTVNNNANFVVRFLLTGSGSTGTSGNDRYDNFAVWGTADSSTTGISELSARSAGYSIYPNPAQNAVNIISDHTGAKIITVYNVVGQTMSVTETGALQTTINTSSLNAGVYFVEIKEAGTGNTYTTKIVKE